VVAVAVGRDGLGRGPRRVAEEALGEALEPSLVHLVDLLDVLVADVAVEVHDEGLDGVRDVVGAVGVHRTGGVRGRRAVLPVVEGRHGGRGKGVRVRRGGVFFLTRGGVELEWKGMGMLFGVDGGLRKRRWAYGP
jgi:hypothetical protein